MRPVIRTIRWVVLAAMLAACARSTNTPTILAPTLPAEAPRLTMSPPTTLPVVPTQTQPPVPTSSVSAAPIPSETPSNVTVATVPSLFATVSAQNVRMRRGPGTLFPMQYVLKQGTKLTVLGKAAGDDWLWVDAGQQQGWVAAAYTSLADSADMAKLKAWNTADAVVVPGRVVTNTGEPIGGVEFALSQGLEKEPPDTRAYSLADGRFYFYLPTGASGKWTFQFVGVRCSSRIVDKNCHTTGTFVPLLRDIDVPAQEDVAVLYFP